MEAMGDFPCHDSTGGQRTKYLRAKVAAGFGTRLYIYLFEDGRKELHAVVVIESHELVILLLRNLMTDGLAIDLCGHHVLSIDIRTVGGDARYFHLPAMLALPIPSLTIILQFEVSAIYAIFIIVEVVLHGDSLLTDLLVLLLLGLLELRLYLWL